MSYLINASEDDIVRGKAYKAYVAYLNSIKDRLPREVYNFALADWHYDFRNPKCPHDGWVQEIKIEEIAKGERHEIRTTQIEIKLLGAYHDRLQKVTYTGVSSYTFSAPASNQGHGDWIIDEISLSDSGLVVHEPIFPR